MNILNKIFIDQRAIIENGINLDLIDLSIYDYIKFSSNSKGVERINTDEGIYFYVDHLWIIEWLPLIKISTKAGIIKRILNLEREGLIIRHPRCEQLKKTYYKFGDKYDLLECSKTKVYNSQQTDRVIEISDRLSLSEQIGNNNNMYNNSNNNNSFDAKIEFLKEFNRVKCSTQPTRVLGDKAVKQLNALLKAGYTITDIGQALENAMKTKNHKDSNYVYLTPEFITRADKFNIYNAANFSDIAKVGVTSDSDYD
jgi:hypothetical protein